MVVDVDEASFVEQVLERSRTLPVVVDFWAAWCGPCRQLGPLLEREAGAREGDVVLAKVDVDANPNLASAFHVQGIPAVKGFRNGAVVAEFVGAQPPAAIARFFDGLAPSEAERLVAVGDEASLRRALELEPARADAAFALARLLAERGEREEALELLDRAPGSFAAAGLAARLRLAPAADPAIARALEALDRGSVEQGLDGLLAALSAPPGDGDGAAERREQLRRVIVAALDELGPADPRARDYRRRLAAALY